METVDLDVFDIRILRHLGEQGRISVQDLSDQIGLSPTPTARRIRRVEEGGIITGYFLALLMGVVDFTPVHEAAWLSIPSFTAPSLLAIISSSWRT